MTEVGRFMDLDVLLRNIAHLLVDVENSDTNVAQKAQKLCKLLYYTETNPLVQPTQARIDSGNDYPTFDTASDARKYIINERVLLVPKVPAPEVRGSFIVIILDDFYLSENQQFKPHTIKFDILIHNEDWLLDNSLRPYVIMQLIDDIFNNRRLSIGKLQFTTAKTIVLTPTMLGYAMVYDNVTIN